jgi:hypothetical protein
MHPVIVARFLVLALACALVKDAVAQGYEERNRIAEQVVDDVKIDRLVLAIAQANLAKDERFQRNLDAVLFRLRPADVWNEQHAAWKPARAALIEIARSGTSDQMHAYWKDYHNVTWRELASTFQPGELLAFRDFVASPAGHASLERRLAEQRAANGDGLYEMDPLPNADRKREALEAKKKWEALPAADRKAAEAFLAKAPCGPCYRPPAEVLEHFLDGQAKWLTEVLGNMLGSTDYHLVDVWLASLDGRLKTALPVSSKKQVIGVLEMRKDGALAFRIKFYAKDRADGGQHVLEFPRGHPNYAEVAALAPGLAAGQSRTLYHDEDGIVSDQP